MGWGWDWARGGGGTGQGGAGRPESGREPGKGNQLACFARDGLGRGGASDFRLIDESLINLLHLGPQNLQVLLGSPRHREVGEQFQRAPIEVLVCPQVFGVHQVGVNSLDANPWEGKEHMPIRVRSPPLWVRPDGAQPSRDARPEVCPGSVCGIRLAPGTGMQGPRVSQIERGREAFQVSPERPQTAGKATSQRSPSPQGIGRAWRPSRPCGIGRGPQPNHKARRLQTKPWKKTS